MDALRGPARLLAFVCLAAIAGPARAATPYAERSDLSQEARGIALVDVENDGGQVSIRPSGDGRLHVRATKLVRGATPERAHELAASMTVEAGLAGSTYRIVVHYPHRIDTVVNFWDLFSGRDEGDAFRPRLEVRLEIEVPAGAALAAATASGDIESAGVPGDQRLSTASGDVVVLGARGALQIGTASGDVRIEEAGRARVRTASGDIDVRGVVSLDAESVSGGIHTERAREALRLRSTSGDVHVEDAPAGIDAQSVSGQLVVDDAAGAVRLVSTSGDVGVRLRGVVGACELGTTSGEVKLAIPDALDADLSLETSSGDMECDLPLRLLEHSRNRMLARCGRGGPQLRLHTSSGDIHVTNHGD